MPPHHSITPFPPFRPLLVRLDSLCPTPHAILLKVKVPNPELWG